MKKRPKKNLPAGRQVKKAKKTRRAKKVIRKAFPQKKQAPLVEEIKKTKIRIIGIGGGGGNIISEIAPTVKRASFIAANTDRQALNSIDKKVLVFQFGEKQVRGLGTGMNPEIAELACHEEKERIKKMLQGQDLVVLVATLGGGVGSGAAPVFAQIARNMQCLTLGIFTLPFQFEGDKKMEIAKASLEKLKSRVNAFVLLPNERIFQVVDKTEPLSKAFLAINKILSESLESLIETVFEPGLINIDFADLKTVLTGVGRLAYLNTVEIRKSEGSARESAEKALNSPLYPYGIKGSKKILFNVSGEKNLELAEVKEISENIFNLANKEAKIIFGISQSKKYKNVIKTAILATGCQMKSFLDSPSKEKPKKAIIQAAAPKKIEKTVNKEKKALPAGRQEKVEIKKIEEKEQKPASLFEKVEEKIRKNALQIKKEIEAEEEAILEKEKIWEAPAFLRKKPIEEG